MPAKLTDPSSAPGLSGVIPAPTFLRHSFYGDAMQLLTRLCSKTNALSSIESALRHLFADDAGRQHEPVGPDGARITVRARQVVKAQDNAEQIGACQIDPT